MNKGMISGEPQPSSTHLRIDFDQSMKVNMNETSNSTASDIATMDDMAFNASLDALLENEGVVGFVDSTDGSTDSAVQSSVMSSLDSSSRFSSTSTTTLLPSLPSQQAQYRYNTEPVQIPVNPENQQRQMMMQRAIVQVASIPTQPFFPTGQTQDQLASMFPPHTMNKQGNCTAPSPLTARLNFPMTATAAAPQYPVVPQVPMVLQQGTLIEAGTGSAARSGANLPPPQSSKRKRASGGASDSQVPAPLPDLASAVSEDEGEGKVRRMGRNQREQQRSQRITEQISQLRDLLVSANVHFKPDKYSTLVSVVDYITELQARSAALDEGHKKLLDTITKTNELVNSAHYRTDANGGIAIGTDLLSDPVTSGPVLEGEIGVFVRGLDYQAVFQHCGMALAIASIDGRFIDCNPEFERLTGYSRKELLPSFSKKHEPIADTILSCTEPSGSDCGSSMTGDDSPKVDEPIRNLSLFNLLDRETMAQVFKAMSQMLKCPLLQQANDTYPAPLNQKSGDFWSGRISQSRLKDFKLRMNVTLVRTPHGRPKFFNCAITAYDEQ